MFSPPTQNNFAGDNTCNGEITNKSVNQPKLNPTGFKKPVVFKLDKQPANYIADIGIKQMLNLTGF